MKKMYTALLVLLAVFRISAQTDERGQIIFRVGDKYEIYAREEKLPDAVEQRKYTYVVDGVDAGYDLVYLCADLQTATVLLTALLDELARTGNIEERNFNVMSMKLYRSENAAFINEVLYMQHEETKWRIASSSTMRVYQKELSRFRQTYEFF
jgi:hypothetical protein